MARLVKVPGIVIQASGVRAKATHITIQCRSCRTYQAGIAVKPGLEGYSLPRKCTTYVHTRKREMLQSHIFIICVSQRASWETQVSNRSFLHRTRQVQVRGFPSR